MKLNFNNFEGPESGPSLIVLHGLFGSGRNWASFAKDISAMYRVLSVDLRNHGASPWDDEMTYPAMAADILELIESEEIENPVLIGHSMGGKAAMTAALQKPDVIDGLILADIAPVQYTHSHVHLVDLMLSLDIAGYTRRSDADHHLAASIDDPTLRGFLLHNLLFEDDGPRWQVNLEVISPNMPILMKFPYEAGTQRFEGPVMVISGAKSNFVLPEYHDTIRSFFPEVDIRSIQDAGHWVHAQKPKEFGAHVLEFMDALTP